MSGRALLGRGVCCPLPNLDRTAQPSMTQGLPSEAAADRDTVLSVGAPDDPLRALYSALHPVHRIHNVGPAAERPDDDAISVVGADLVLDTSCGRAAGDVF